jgi:hypothetical protein
VRHGSTDIDGYLTGSSACQYRIEFYWNIDSIPGNCERYLGAIVVPPGPFRYSLNIYVPDGDTITAVATSLCDAHETSEISFPYKISPATTPRTPPTIGPPTVVGGKIQAVSGQIQLPVGSPDGENIVIRTTHDLRMPMSQWKTDQVLPAIATWAFLKAISGILQAYYMAVLPGPGGNLMVTVTDSAGDPMAGAMVGLGCDEAPVAADENGAVEYDDYPAGYVDLVLQWELTVIYGGLTNIYTNGIYFPVTVKPDSANQYPVKVVIPAATNSPPPACGCAPWCAMMAGIVDGVEQLEISGGANGSCGQQAVVQITPPSGLSFTLSAGQTLLETPAADGTWTVTSTVCNMTKTAQITIP